VSPSASSVASVVQAEQSAAFFYLHDPEGNLHTAVDQTGHETNKRQYLR
jgi:cell division protein YceG involved in septum cleavage